jgi:hypothetical protein
MKNRRRLQLNPSLVGERRAVAKMIDDMGAGRTDICLRSAGALAQACRGIRPATARRLAAAGISLGRSIVKTRPFAPAVSLSRAITATLSAA